MVSMDNVLEYWTTITQELLSDSIDFTPEEITTLLSDMGLVGKQENCRIEELEKYIFLYGNEEEIYGYEERFFIECVGSVYIYNDLNRKTNKGMIATKIFAVDLSRFDDAVKSCFFLMKVINKANDGFNVFLFKTDEGFFLGCRLYDKDLYKNCVLTKAIRNEEELGELTEKLMYLPDTSEFIPYYSSLVETIEYRKEFMLDYDLKIMLKRGVNFSYLDMLSDVEQTYHVNLEYAKEKYYESFNMKESLAKDDDYTSVVDSLKFIKSDRTNTLEMLFEAEEMALLANQMEEDNDRIKESILENKVEDESIDEELRRHINNPEMMIKLLKEKRNA